MHRTRFGLSACAVAGLTLLVAADAAYALAYASIFGDNMVLQSGKPVPVWGAALPGEKVTVNFAGQEKTATTDAMGMWTATLDALEPSAEPAEMVIAGSRTLTLRNVLVGEVWLCGGQSNMYMPVAKVKDAEAEIGSARCPLIRLNTKKWQVCSPDTVKSFSATAYFFGRRLNSELKVPIGLIHRSVGGTPIEQWTPLDDLMRVPYARRMYAKYNSDDIRMRAEREARQFEQWAAKRKEWEKAKGKGGNAAEVPAMPARTVNPYLAQAYCGKAPGCLYDVYIKPLVPVALRGIIWYQGERNARTLGGAQAYRELLPNMIASWRKAFAQGDIPFLYVQLPDYADGANWELIRESMLKALATPKTGMAVAIDAGDGTLHPANKQVIGTRLALAALHAAYGRDVVYSGPVPGEVKVAGTEIRVTFEHAEGGLTTRDGDLTGFEMAGEDRKFVGASARIEGGAVIVSSEQVAKPAAVRYGWAPAPKCNLYNKEGLPASPFRTDDWPIEGDPEK